MSLELIGIHHRYGNLVVLSDVSVRFDAGTVTALRGPSGSGKTTLLAIMGGLLRPTAGRVVGPVRKPGDLQWIHQTVNLLGRRTAVDNVMLALFSQGVSRRDARPKALVTLKDIKMQHMADRRANTLSGGEAQRISIARALVGSPALVLADEPTGHLDRATTKIVIEAMLALRNPRSVVVVATHDSDVADACDRGLLVDHGTVMDDS